MAGAVGGHAGDKIKGGKWTVFKFFSLGVAYTIVWMAFCSELGYYKSLYGPSVLLQMNIMYFLPSIPLLILSSLLDEYLDRRFGVSKTILMRLMVGLIGCAAIAAVFPFMPEPGLRALLWSVGSLGLVHGISFSASYQLVSRFAGKNTISLGLGCVGSGGIVLAVEVALRITARPTRGQTLSLYLVCSAFAIAGLVASVSLLLRHWKSIEATAAAAQRHADAGSAADPARQPLLEQIPGQPAWPEDPEAAQPGEEADVEKPLWAHPSGVLFALSPLDHFQSVSEGDTMLSLDKDSSLSIIWPEPSSVRRQRSTDLRRKSSSMGRNSTGSRHASLQHASTEPARSMQALAHDSQRAGRQADASAVSSRAHVPSPAAHTLTGATEPVLAAGQAASVASASAAGDPHDDANAREVLRAIWPTMAGLFFSGTCGLLIFPFLTYVPSDGMLGELLPKTLFFVRLGADLVGRMIPRVKGAAMTSQGGLLALGAVSVASTPLFFAYLKTPPQYHNDWLAIWFIAYLWLLNGAVNSNAYILAPRLVTARQKPTAAGMLAMIYQLAHVIGLVVGVIIVVYEFGGFGGPS